MMALWQGLRVVFTHPLNKGKKWRTLSKVLFWKLNQLTSKFPVAVDFANGIKCLCYPDSSYGGLVVYTGYPEYESMKVWERMIKPQDVVIDVGANIGLVSLLASPKTKQAIYAFEADPRVFPRLQENIRLNDLGHQISAINNAVSDRQGKLAFTLESQSEISHLTYKNVKTRSVRKHKMQSVTSVVLDQFVAAKGIKRKLVVKVDVEGAELLVFKGMKKSFQKQQVKYLTFEMNKNCVQFGYQPQELLAWLESFDYQIFSLDPVAQVTADSVITFDQQSAFNLVAAPRQTISLRSLQKALA